MYRDQTDVLKSDYCLLREMFQTYCTLYTSEVTDYQGLPRTATSLYFNSNYVSSLLLYINTLRAHLFYYYGLLIILFSHVSFFLRFWGCFLIFFWSFSVISVFYYPSDTSLIGFFFFSFLYFFLFLSNAAMWALDWST